MVGHRAYFGRHFRERVGRLRTSTFAALVLILGCTPADSAENRDTDSESEGGDEPTSSPASSGSTIPSTDTDDACAPETFRCAGNDVERCRIDGSDWEFYRSCGPEEACSSGECVDSGVCGDRVCGASEDCSTCESDCACAPTETCNSQGVCTQCSDADEDDVCDIEDACLGSDDALDADDDGVPDGCDQCEGDDDLLDEDADGVPDGCDVCADADDADDGDADGVPDGCDLCEGADDRADDDADAVPDGCDVCLGFDDSSDADADAVPDGCDACAGSDDTLDADGDTVPDGCDSCEGVPDALAVDSFDAPADWTTEPGATVAGGQASFFTSSGSLSATITRNSPACLLELGPGQRVGLELQMQYEGTPFGDVGSFAATVDSTLVRQLRVSEIFSGVNAGVDVDRIVCMGEIHNAGLVSLELGVQNLVADYTVSVDQVRFVLDPPTCAVAGEVLNGDFEDPTGWVTNNGPAPIELDPVGGTDALHLLYDGCSPMNPGNIVSGPLSVPLSGNLPNATLRFQLRGDLTASAEPIFVRLEYANTTSQLATYNTLPATSAQQTLCVPAGIAGRAGSLVFAHPINCSDGVREVWVDDIELVSDPASCP